MKNKPALASHVAHGCGQIAALLLFSQAFSACVSYQAKHDTHESREYLVEDLEDQIVYNLIRGKNGLPFAHYDVQTINASVESRFTPTATVGQTVTHNNYPSVTQKQTTPGKPLSTVITTTVGAASSALQTIARPFSIGAGDERDNTVTLASKPIFDEPKVYAAYVKFLNVDNDGPYGEDKESSTAKKKAGDNANTTSTVTTEKDVDPTTKKLELKKEWREDVTPPKDKPKTTIKLAIHGFEEHVKSVVEVPPSEKPRDYSPANYVVQMHSGHLFYIPKDYVKRTLRYWEGSYYYVPKEYADAYSKLCVALVARGTVASDGVSTTGPATVKKTSQDTQQLQELNLNLQNLQNQFR